MWKEIILFVIVIYIIYNFYKRKNRKFNSRSTLKICFVHPDLGIGGAEKLVVELAVGLQQSGHVVSIYTAYHDMNPTRSFPPTNNGTLKIHLHGNFLPYHAVGKFQLLKALVRFIWLTGVVIINNFFSPFDVIFVDQISVTLPLLKLFCSGKIIFYCHFPDQLLTSRPTWLKWLYRLPLDFLEEITTAVADEIVVNSKYTETVVKKTFKTIKRKLHIIYPGVDFKKKKIDKDFSEEKTLKIISLNRYERKKNIGLALETFSLLKNTPQYINNRLELIIAGGYSTKVEENVEHLKELKLKAKELGISDHVQFKLSVTSEERDKLIEEALCLLYTPENEHFGIVPIEAGSLGTPVIACDSGGPLESIIDGKTGFLRSPNPQLWADAIKRLLNNTNLILSMGKQAQDRVRNQFTWQKSVKDLIDLCLK